MTTALALGLLQLSDPTFVARAGAWCHFGDFLGAGNRKIAVDWNAAHHFATAAGNDDRITIDLTRDQVKAAPGCKNGGLGPDRHSRQPARSLSEK